MAYDFRDMFSDLKKRGELLEIDQEVDWNLEAAAIAAMSYRVEGPAVVFNKLKGYPPGYRLVAGLFAGTLAKPWRRIALAMGLDPDVDLDTVRRVIGERLQNPIKPIEVSTGPCKEEIHLGAEANLLEFPFPYCHEGDGGRYSTMHIVMTADPDSDWVNCGNYRMMVYGKRRATVYFTAGQQGRTIFQTKYEDRGETMPVVIAIGGDPLAWFCAALSLPAYFNELDYAGGLRGEPMELVRAETCDLLVPANAEIVIEGEIRPNERLEEGPFGEYPLFHQGPRKPTFAIRVNCITHRKDPIIPFLSAAPVNECHSVASTLLGTAYYWKAVTEKGMPVKQIYHWPHAPFQSAIVSTKVPNYPGYIRDLANVLFSQKMFTHYDYLTFVDAEVDPADVSQVLEEWFTKTNPKRDYKITDQPEGGKAAFCGPYLDEQDLERNVLGDAAHVPKVFIDATTKPGTRTRRLVFENLFPESLQEKVVTNWTKWGFEDPPVWRKAYMERPVERPDLVELFGERV